MILPLGLFEHSFEYYRTRQCDLTHRKFVRMIMQTVGPLRYNMSMSNRENVPATSLFTVEMEHDSGYRSWSGGMTEDKINFYIDGFGDEYGLSDIDHAGECHGTCSEPVT